jgi:hypothetical protein
MASARYKLSIVVEPFSPAGSSKGETRKWMEIAAPQTTIRQLWNRIEETYKRNYLNQNEYG